MIYSAAATLVADRYATFKDDWTFKGFDLTGATMKLQVRDRKDGGELRVDLATVETANTQGLRLLSAGLVDGVMTSVVHVRINKATLSALPFAGPPGAQGELGDDLVLKHDLLVTLAGGDPQVLLHGDFILRAGVTE